jgi:hypothetical protein
MTDEERKQAEASSKVRQILQDYHRRDDYSLESAESDILSLFKVAEAMPTEEDKAIRKFYIWMVRFLDKDDLLVPVISIDELIQLFRSSMKENNKPQSYCGNPITSEDTCDVLAKKKTCDGCKFKTTA